MQWRRRRRRLSARPAIHNEACRKASSSGPASSYCLTAGSCLLLHVAGPKREWILSAPFSVPCLHWPAAWLGLGGGEVGGMIAFRALQGVTNAIITPSSTSIISSNVERRTATKCGWLPAFYLAAAASLVLLLISIWALPGDTRPKAGHSVLKRVASEIETALGCS